VTGVLSSRPSTGPDAAQPAPGNLAQRIERVLRLRPIIEEQAAASYEDWKQLEERTAALTGSTDPVVNGFGAFLRREAVASIKLGDEGFDGLPQLKHYAGTANRLLEALRTTPPNAIDTVRFDEQVASRISPAEPSMEDVQRWLTQRPLYAIKRQQIDETYARLQKDKDATVEEVAKSEPEESEAVAFAQEQRDVEAALKEFRQTPFIERDVADGKFEGKVAQIQGQIKNLKLYYHAENAEDWLKNLPGIATSSERMKVRWDAWVDTLRAELKVMAADRAVFTQYKARTDKLRDLMTDLELQFPPVPEGLSEKFADAARQRREERIGALLDNVKVADPKLTTEQLKQASEAMAQWFALLEELNREFPLKKKVFTLADRPDDKWRKREAFWNDQAVQKLVRGDVDRLERLRKLPSASRQELVKFAGDNTVRDEVVLAAWQLLGDGRVSPPWPATSDELKAEANLRAKVRSKLAQLDAVERKALEDVYAREGPRRWRRFVESADAEEMLVTATDLGERWFGVDAVVMGEMSAEARFNVWLCLANRAIRRDSKPAAAPANPQQVVEDFNNIVDHLQSAARQLPEPKSSQVLDKLARLNVAEPFANLEMGETFSLPIKGVDDPLEFRRVEPSDGARPFYVGTREVTFAQFAGVLDGNNLWDEARKLAWPYRIDKGDARRGARVWEWADVNSPRLALPRKSFWMVEDNPNRHNDFPIDFRGPKWKFNVNVIAPEFGGLPSERHPMQYVSAQAALYYAAALGCRLPTSGEWRHALSASGATPAKGDWNLRDQSWEVFRAHADKFRIAFEHWPDRGSFPSDPAGPPPNFPQKDDVLLFRAVPAADQKFHDLVGNVAEYVLQEPDAWARGAKRTADDIRNFLTDTPDAVAVIGGSAFSPANVPVDKPLRADRTDKGYSDVGLRLAFTAPSKTPAERLRWVLVGEDYVWPRTASAATGVR
jgi:hypothetical protein